MAMVLNKMVRAMAVGRSGVKELMFGDWAPALNGVAVSPSGDQSGVTDDANINAAIAKAAAGYRRVLIRKGNQPYRTAGGIRHLSSVDVEFEPGTVIKMRDRMRANVLRVDGNKLFLSTVEGMKQYQHVADAAVTPATFQATGQAVGSIPFAAMIGAVNEAEKSITLVGGYNSPTALQPIAPTGPLPAGINVHPRANVWSTLNCSDFSLRCPGGWAIFDGNWKEMYPYDAFSDDASRNCLRQYSAQNFVIDGISCENAFFHGTIAVAAMSGARVERYRTINNGYRSIHYHSESVTGGVQQPEVRDNYFRRLEINGDGHRAFYTRDGDENNSGLFLLFQRVINTQVDSILAKDCYGFAFVAAGGDANWVGKYSRHLTINSIMMENCGEGFQMAGNVSGVKASGISVGREDTINNAVFYAAASSPRYFCGSKGDVGSIMTRAIDLPNQTVDGKVVGAIAAFGLRAGYRVYAGSVVGYTTGAAGSLGAGVSSSVAGMLIWEVIPGGGAGGVDRILVFRDDSPATDPYTNAATTPLYVHGTKGAAVGLSAQAGAIVTNVDLDFLAVNAAKGFTTHAANGVYRYNDVKVRMTIKRGYKQGFDLSSIRNLKAVFHTEDCASGYPTGGGGPTYDNYVQNCTGELTMTTSLDQFPEAGYNTRALRIDTECRALTIRPLSLQKPKTGPGMIECRVAAGAGANLAGVTGPVVLVNPLAHDGTPLTVAAGQITRNDAVTCLITRPVDAA